MNQTVSVIIPTYNRQDLLCRAVESALNQTYPHIEIIVVDDGSTDATVARLATFGDKIQCLQELHCGNISTVRNKGIVKSTGEFIAFLDSDDAWMPTKIEKQIRHFESSNVTLSYTDAVIETDAGTSPPAPPLQMKHGRLVKSILQGQVILPVTLMFRKTILRQTGLLNDSLDAMGDFYFILRLAQLGEAACVSEPLVKVQRKTGHHSAEFEETNLHNLLKAVNLFEQQSNLSFGEKLARRGFAARLHATLARNYRSKDQLSKARRHIQQSLLNNPFSPSVWRFFMSAYDQ